MEASSKRSAKAQIPDSSHKRKTVKLDDTTISKLPLPTTTREEIADTEISGFHLIIRPSGILSFVLRYTSPITHKRASYTIGRYGTLTATHARKTAKQKAAEIALGIDPQLQKKTNRKNEKQKRLATLGAFYFDSYKAGLEIRRNGKKIIAHLEKTFIHPWKDKLLIEINNDLIKQWRVKRIKEGVKSSTVNRDIAPLRALLKEAYKTHLIPEHPLAVYTKLPVDTEGVVRYFEDNEKLQFLNALLDRQEKQREARHKYNKWLIARKKTPLNELDLKFTDHLMPMCILAMNTGMRRSEIFLLHWSHINFNNSVLTVKSKNAKSEKHRHIPLNSIAMETLKEWKKISSSADFVFINPTTNEPFTNIDSSWKNIMKSAKIINFRFHDLRHEFASRLVMKGVSLYTVKELLGHSTIEMTQKYAHIAPNEKAMAVNLLV